MQTIGIETGQNVIIKQEVAGVGERIASQLIDYLIMLSYFIVFSLIMDQLVGRGSQDISILLILLPVFFYSLLTETFLQGQSFGKKILKIKVVKIDGSQAAFGNYLIRWLFRLIDVNLFYGIVAIITIAVNGKGQRIGDIVAKTSVINLRKTKKIEDTIYIDVPETYIPVYPSVELLKDADIQTIKDVINHYKKDVYNAIAISMVEQTIEAVKKKTGIIDSKPPLLFLEVIVKDYNALHKTKV